MIRVLAIALVLGACAGPVTGFKENTQSAAEPWSLSKASDGLKSVSCVTGDSAKSREMLITATPIELGGTLDGLKYVGGWHLTSDEADFGGLSGLDVLPNGDLLTVSDRGRFIEIAMSGATPNGAGKISAMRANDGSVLQGKIPADAEGLAYQNGIALVSFERDHRILGFAYGECGAAARGIKIAALPSEHAGRSINPNKGAEALSLNAAGEITFGYESGAADSAPLGTVFGDGSVQFIADGAAPDDLQLVGRDQLGDHISELFRAYDRVRGNRIVIRLGDSDRLIQKPMSVDNFEGIALQKTESGLRVWIMSDDNFNPRQRTLLLAFDIENAHARGDASFRMPD